MVYAGKEYQHEGAAGPKDTVAIPALALPPLRRHYSSIFIPLALLVLYLWYATHFRTPDGASYIEEHGQPYPGRQPATIFLPWAKPFKSTSVPLVKTTIEGISIDMPVDTGSTGVLIGAPLLPHLPPTAGTPAFHYLTSSGILYNGRFVNLNMRFHSSGGAHAEARIPVLVVDKSWICPWYKPAQHGFSCPPGPNGEAPVSRDTSQITYMGVGFGRNSPGSGQPDAVPAVNPFLNIASVNGRAVPSGSMHQGWVISSQGVHVGLTETNTKDFRFMQLEPGVIHHEDARDWAMARTNFRVNGKKAGTGAYGLVDTGVAQMYIRADKDGSLPVVKIRKPHANGTAKEVERVKPGTHISVGFAALGEPEAARYSFVVGAAALMAPSFVVPGTRTPGPFINTGRNFLRGYSIAFDAVHGRFGLGPARVSPSSS